MNRLDKWMRYYIENTCNLIDDVSGKGYKTWISNNKHAYIYYKEDGSIDYIYFTSD